jgi:hypothetical protein
MKKVFLIRVAGSEEVYCQKGFNTMEHGQPSIFLTEEEAMAKMEELLNILYGCIMEVFPAYIHPKNPSFK